MLIPTAWNNWSPVTELFFAFPFQEAASWHSAHESCPGPPPGCRKKMCSTRASLGLLKLWKRVENLMLAVLLTQVGWRASSPLEGGNRLLALDTCMIQQRSKRLSRCQWVPVGEKREASSQGMQWPQIVFLHVFKPHRKGKWKLWINNKRKRTERGWQKSLSVSRCCTGQLLAGALEQLVLGPGMLDRA